eukprot:m.1954 g.1954  ORF g.1954 m.1954 type:complete len:298 (+) comp8092_c0_seq2:155-1048(+)
MKRNYRKRRHYSDSEGEEEAGDVRQTLEETKEVQKFRQRPKGVSAAGLAWGKKCSREEEMQETDPFKLKTGGLVKLSKTKEKEEEEEDMGISLKETFASETRHREEDKRMMQYIDDQMAKKKGDRQESDKDLNYFEAKKAALYSLPEPLRAISEKRSEEMLSNQMLSGIPEVDLGIEEKFRNISETEKARQKVLEEKRKKKGEKESFLPTNMSADFVHHNRFLREDAVQKKKVTDTEMSEANKPKLTVGCLDEQNPLDPVVRGSALDVPKVEKPKPMAKATDNYHFEKFKKKSIRKF